MIARTIVLVMSVVALRAAGALPGFERGAWFGEQVRWVEVASGVRVFVDSPGEMDGRRETVVVVYATPNGSSIEETLGCAKGEGVGWRYDLQHVLGQIRRFREVDGGRRNVVLAVVEAPGRSWPGFRRDHTDANEVIRRVVEEVRKGLVGVSLKVVLAGHSGGGAFIFGFINGADAVPEWVERIVFLDANYAYSDDAKERHGEKLLAWLRGDAGRRLVVIAYDDREIVLEGKKVVGPEGGTFRASERMIARFKKDVEIERGATGDFVRYSGLEGRIQFFVHPNRENKILHTALVGEMNGLLQGLALGTELEGKWGVFGGPRAYEKWVPQRPERGPTTRPAVPPGPADASRLPLRE
jgi:hypothetical protein